MKTVTLLVVLILPCLVAACAPAAPTPTPTPEPTPTPVWVLATKPEHLAGLWYHTATTASRTAKAYVRFEPDGTMKWDYNVEEPTRVQERFWFEDGVYYEEGSSCDPIGSYRAYLRIEEGRAVALRFEEVDDSDPSCTMRRERKSLQYYKVDR